MSKSKLGRAFVVAVMLVAGPVWADEPPSTSGAPSAEAVYVQGKRLADEGQWEAALSLFKDAYEMDPSPKRAAHLGRAQVMTKRFTEGATNLARYLREEKDSPEDVRAAVEALLREAKTKIATVTLKVDTQGAKVRIDKQEVSAERVALPQFLAPGNHEFEVSKEGFVTTTVQHELHAGEAFVVPLKLVEVLKEGPGEVPVIPVKKNGSDKRVIIAGAAVSGGLLLLAAGLGGASKSKNDDAVGFANVPNCNADLGCRQGYGAAYSASTNYGAGALVSLGLGVVGGALTFAYWWTGRRSADSSGVAKVSVVATPTVGGFVVRGAW